MNFNQIMLTVDYERYYGGVHRIARRLRQLARVVARVFHVRWHEDCWKRESAWHATRLKHLQNGG